VKDTWPPSKHTSIETIAASFVPPKAGSAGSTFPFCRFTTLYRDDGSLTSARSFDTVRLFNLAVDVPSAGLQDGTGRTLATGAKLRCFRIESAENICPMMFGDVDFLLRNCENMLQG